MTGSWMRFLPASIRRRVEGHSQIRKILGNISWLSLDRVVRMGVGLLVGVWVARYLGRDQFGTLNFAAAFVSLFSPLAVLGLDSIVIRDLVGITEKGPETLGTAFWLKLVGGIVSGSLATVVIVLTRPGEPLLQTLVIIAAAGVLFQSLDVIDFWFQSRIRSKYVVYARNGAFLLMAAVRVALILLQAPLIAFALATSAELALAAVGLVILYQKQGERLSLWRGRIARVKALLRDGWPLFLAGVSIAIYMRIDQVMIGYMLNDAAVGIYSAAIRLVEIWYFLPTAIGASVLPALIRARKEDESFYVGKLQTFYDIMGGLALLIAAVMSIFSTPIISILYGQKFEGAGPILAVYAWASVPVFLGAASSQHFIVENLTRVTLYRTFAGLVANVCLNFLLIPILGPLGAAVASLVSQSIVAFSIALIPGTGRQAVMLLTALNPFRAYRHLRGEDGVEG
jgi:PST family polysaccharide transporter